MWFFKGFLARPLSSFHLLIKKFVTIFKLFFFLASITVK